MTTRRRPLSDLARLAATGAGLPEILPELGPHLDAVLGIDSYAIHWYGPDAELTAFHADKTWSAAAIDAYLADYRSRQSHYQPITRQRLARREAFALTHNEMARRAVFHEVIAPLGLGSFLNLPLDLGQQSAILTCARERSAATAGGRFAQADLERANRMSEMLRPVFAAPPNTASFSPRPDSAGSAFLLLSRDGEVRHACAEGRRFLALLNADARCSKPKAIQTWFEDLLLRGRENAKALHSLLHLHDGIYEISIRPLDATSEDAETLFALQIQRTHTAARRLLELARRHGMSPRELAIAQRLHRGEALREIAAALQVSETTLKTQTRSLYGRIGVSDRHELQRAIHLDGSGTQ